MKVISFVTSYPILDEPVVKNRLLPFISYAIKKGYHVNLVTPDDQKLGCYSDDEFSHFLVANPKISKNAGFLKRALYELLLSRSLIRKVNSLESDGVFVTVPSMFLVFSGFFVNCKSAYLDLRDITWEYLSDSSLLNRTFKKWFRSLLRKSLSKFDVVSVTNDTELEYIKGYVNDYCKILKIPNGISRGQFDAIRVRPGKERKHAPSKSMVVSYVGNVGMAQNLKCLLDAASHLPEVEFRVIGGGNALEEVQAHARKSKLSNVSLTGRVNWDEIPRYYQESDILYAQLSSNFSGAMPSKLYEYLATGKPIIYGGMGQAVEVLKGFDNVYIIEPDESSSIVSAVRSAQKDGVVGACSYLNPERIEEEFIRENNVRKFFDVL